MLEAITILWLVSGLVNYIIWLVHDTPITVAEFIFDLTAILSLHLILGPIPFILRSLP